MSREGKWKAEMRAGFRNLWHSIKTQSLQGVLINQTILVVVGDFYHIQSASALCIYQPYFLDKQRTHTPTR